MDLCRKQLKDVVHLVTHKCLPILLYGTEVFPLNKSDLNYFDIAINRFLMKTFKTNNVNIIEECRVNVGVTSPSSFITRKKLVNLSRNLNSLIIVYVTYFLNR